MQKNKFQFVLTLVLAVIAVCSTASAAVPAAPPATQFGVAQFTPPQLWSVLFYVGGTAKQSLGDMLLGGYTPAGESIFSTELAYTLAPTNRLYGALEPLVDAVQVAGNFALRNDYKDSGLVEEGDVYFMLRHTQFPWNNYVTTTVAAGEGVSYATAVPYVENGITSDSSERFLNFLVFEVTFALPSYPRLQLVARIHHRSSAYGLYADGHAGSNNEGLGIRYYF